MKIRKSLVIWMGFFWVLAVSAAPANLLPRYILGTRVELPRVGNSSSVFCDGRPIKVTCVGNRWVVDGKVKGTVIFEVREK